MPQQNNRLAPPLQNSLAYSVPVPLDPGMLRPAPTRFVPQRELENLSIGLGRGVRSGMEGTKQMLTQPVATAQALIEAARQLGTDPRIVLDMLRAARQKAMSGSLGLGELIGENITPGMRGRRIPAMRELDVYHGTPHRFPATEANPLGEFDASKIGTGEGAQAYGHGVYLAEGQNVGKGYQKRLSGSGYRNAATDEIVDSGKAWQAATKAVQDAGIAHPDRAGQIASQIQDWVDSGRTSKSFLLNRQVPKQLEPAYQAAIDSFDNLRLNKGSLYKADLPDEMIDRMLDYDKPLKEQPANVQKFFSKIYKPDNYLTDWLKQGDPEDIAKILQEEGIPGIKYLDAGSRGQGGSGTRNFVVFPGEEKKVRILERK